MILSKKQKRKKYKKKEIKNEGCYVKRWKPKLLSDAGLFFLSFKLTYNSFIYV